MACLKICLKVYGRNDTCMGEMKHVHGFQNYFIHLLKFMGEMGEMTCMYIVCLKVLLRVYGRNDIKKTCTRLKKN